MSYSLARSAMGACCSGCASGMGALPGAVDTSVRPGESIYDYMARIGREMKTATVDAQYVAQQKAAAAAAAAFPGVTPPPLPPVSPPVSPTTKLLVVGGVAVALFMLTRKKRR